MTYFASATLLRQQHLRCRSPGRDLNCSEPF